jgi:putative transposase
MFVTTYRPKVSTNAMLTCCENTTREVCTERNAELVEFNAQAHHVHLLVSNPPTQAISTQIQPIKSRTAHAVRRAHTGACRRARMRRHLQSPSYLAVSRAGAPPSIIKHYINGQTRPL